MNKKIFISYSHTDKAKVKKFALLISLHGFDLWMDEKDVSFGDNYTTKILSGIHESDIYIIFVSANSVNSKWVNAEIDFALQEKIENKKLIIIPVLLDDVEVPVPLKNINYIDARFSMNSAADELAQKFKGEEKEINELVVSSVSFCITKATSVEIGPFNEAMTTDDLKTDRDFILEDLRKKAYGILMNFVPAIDFDFSSTTPKFTNGIYEETAIKEKGSTSGSIREKIRVETIVFNPNMNKVNRLLKDRIEILNISAITFGFSIPLKENETMADIEKRCFKKIQDDYIILSYDTNEGARIEFADDFFLSLHFSDELMKLKLSTKYDFQFAKRIENFSVFDYVKKLIE